MAKRDNGTTRANRGTTTTSASGATTADPIEQRLVAFAEQLGRMVGTIQTKAEGWMDRETLSKDGREDAVSLSRIERLSQIISEKRTERRRFRGCSSRRSERDKDAG